MVRMPMAMSRKNVEKPVVRICRSLVPAFRKRTGRSVQRREKKWDSILSLIHISEPTRLGMISYAVFCLKKKKKQIEKKKKNLYFNIRSQKL